jgi:hypothetical protein
MVTNTLDHSTWRKDELWADQQIPQFVAMKPKSPLPFLQEPAAILGLLKAICTPHPERYFSHRFSEIF